VAQGHALRMAFLFGDFGCKHHPLEPSRREHYLLDFVCGEAAGDRHLLHDLDSKRVEADDFSRVVGQQPNRSEAEVGENLRADSGFMLRRCVPFAGHIVRAHSEAGLMQIHQHSRIICWQLHRVEPNTSP